MRHYLPTYAKFGERRFARPTDAYDVMRVRDSWLCAQLADEATRFAIRRDLAWTPTFERMMKKLGADSWGASVAFYLTKRFC